MAIANPPSIVSFDAEEVCKRVEETVEGTLRSVVEYNQNEFNPIWVSEGTLALYENEDHMMSHFERIHGYVHLDFHAINLYTDSLFPPAERVRFIATGFDLFTLLRVYIGDEGLFLALDPDEPIKPIISTIEDYLWSDD